MILHFRVSPTNSQTRFNFFQMERDVLVTARITPRAHPRVLLHLNSKAKFCTIVPPTRFSNCKFIQFCTMTNEKLKMYNNTRTQHNVSNIMRKIDELLIITDE